MFQSPSNAWTCWHCWTKKKVFIFEFLFAYALRVCLLFACVCVRVCFPIFNITNIFKFILDTMRNKLRTNTAWASGFHRCTYTRTYFNILSYFPMEKHSTREIVSPCCDKKEKGQSLSSFRHVLFSIFQIQPSFFIRSLFLCVCYRSHGGILSEANVQ